MKKDPVVFVIILNWNGNDCLFNALRSVFCSAYKKIQVIVVDNASTDGSFEKARQLFGKAVFIRNEANLGFARGINIGIRYALSHGADAVWLLNNDAIADERALERLIDVAQNRPEDIFSPVIRTPEGREWFSGGNIQWWRMRVCHDKKSHSAETPYETGFLSGCALFCSSEVFRTLGLFDERYFLYYEDADFSIRALRAGKKLVVVPTAVVAHRERSEAHPEKLYHLVFSGLQFFSFQSSVALRPWLFCFTIARRVKNAMDCFRGKKTAFIVRRAYRDYATKKASF